MTCEFCKERSADGYFKDYIFCKDEETIPVKTYACEQCMETLNITGKFHTFIGELV